MHLDHRFLRCWLLLLGVGVSTQFCKRSAFHSKTKRFHNVKSLIWGLLENQLIRTLLFQKKYSAIFPVSEAWENCSLILKNERVWVVVVNSAFSQKLILNCCGQHFLNPNCTHWNTLAAASKVKKSNTRFKRIEVTCSLHTRKILTTTFA